jgi:hypothetical protein
MVLHIQSPNKSIACHTRATLSCWEHPWHPESEHMVLSFVWSDFLLFHKTPLRVKSVVTCENCFLIEHIDSRKGTTFVLWHDMAQTDFSNEVQPAVIIYVFIQQLQLASTLPTWIDVIMWSVLLCTQFYCLWESQIQMYGRQGMTILHSRVLYLTCNFLPRLMEFQNKYDSSTIFVHKRFFCRIKGISNLIHYIFILWALCTIKWWQKQNVRLIYYVKLLRFVYHCNTEIACGLL